MSNRIPLDKEDFYEDGPDCLLEDESEPEFPDEEVIAEDEEGLPPEEENEDPVDRELRISQARYQANMLVMAERHGGGRRISIKTPKSITPKVDPRDSLVQQYARENVDLKRKVNTLEELLKKARSGQPNQSQPVSTSSQADNQQVTERVNQLEAQVKELMETIEKNKEEIVQLTNSRNKANRRCQDCRELNQLDDLLKKERKEHSDERSQWINDKKNLERELEQVKKDKGKLVEELKSTNEEFTRLRTSLVQDSEFAEIATIPQNPMISLSREQTDGCVTTIFSFSFNQGQEPSS